MSRTAHPDANRFPQCSARSRIRKAVPDCYCRHAEYNGGHDKAIVTLDHCLACPFAGSNGPVPPPRPKVGDVFAHWLSKWHRVTEPEGCDCTKLSTEMNGNGPDWCEENADYLAGRVIANLNATKRPERFLPDRVKRAYVRWLIQRAARYCREWKTTEAG